MEAAGRAAAAAWLAGPASATSIPTLDGLGDTSYLMMSNLRAASGMTRPWEAHARGDIRKRSLSRHRQTVARASSNRSLLALGFRSPRDSFRLLQRSWMHTLSWRQTRRRSIEP